MSCKHPRILYVIALSGYLVAQTLPSAPARSVVSLTPGPGGFSEPSIAVSPTNPSQLVAAFQTNASVASSIDGGRTWQLATGVAPANFKVSGDVSVAYDNEGRAFICYIAFDKLGTFNYWAHGASHNGIFVRRSLDGGKTWEANHIPVIEQPTQLGIPFEDKPYIVVDTSQGSHAGNLYVGWTRWSLTDSRILFVRSTDHGKSWSAPIEIDDHPGLPRDDNGALEGFAGAVGADGSLYVVWNNREGIEFTVSRDGGQKFSKARTIIQTAPSMFAVENFSRANGFPQIAAYGSHLYVSWSDYRNGDLDVFCATSSDRGRHWSTPVRVNDDALHNGADQFAQWMAADAKDGSINVVFYDRRDDHENKKQRVVIARSQDGGLTFRNFALTDEAFDASGPFMGDYNGIAAFAGRVYAAWTERVKTDPEKKPKGETIVRVGIADFR